MKKHASQSFGVSEVVGRGSSKQQWQAGANDFEAQTLPLETAALTTPVAFCVADICTRYMQFCSMNSRLGPASRGHFGF